MARTKQTIRRVPMIPGTGLAMPPALPPMPRKKPEIVLVSAVGSGYKRADCGKRVNRSFPLSTKGMRRSAIEYYFSHPATVDKLRKRNHLTVPSSAPRGQLCTYTTALWKNQGYVRPQARKFKSKLRGTECEPISMYCGGLKRCLPRNKVCWSDMPDLDGSAAMRRKNRAKALARQKTAYAIRDKIFG